jgi:putative membrane protein
MPSEDTSTGVGQTFKPELKLHASSWLFGVVAYLKSFLFPVIIAAIIGSGRGFALWAPAVLIVPLLIAALWQQWVYRYGFSANGLVIHEGLFFRNVRSIDYTRIENVDTERGLLHRLFGVADVRVETSTGGSAEARIRVLDLAAVDDLRKRIFAQRRQAMDATPGPPPAVAEPEEALLALGPGELVRFGLIDNRGTIIVVALLGLLAQGGFFENIEEWAGPWLGQLPWEDVAAVGLLVQLLLGVATAIVLIAATRVLSIILAFTILYDFRLTRAADDLHTRYGLLTRVSRTLRQPRIQAVHQTATLLHRLFQRVSLRVDLAGAASAIAEGHPQAGQSPRRDLWLAPLCPRDAAEGLMQVALPQLHLAGLQWQTLAAGAPGRIFRLLSISWLVAATFPAVWFSGWWAAAILLGPLPLFWLHAAMYVKHTGWALHEDFFVLKRGWLSRKLAVARRDRIQSVQLRESPFDRRYRMTRLSVDNAGATAASHRFAIAYLDHGDAKRLARALVFPQSAAADSG